VNLFVRATEVLRDRIARSGAEDGGVTIARSPDALTCPYERGVPLEAEYGGRIVQFVTGAPLEARVRVSMLFGAPLAREGERSAAGAVLNAVTGFFGFARHLAGCRIEDRPPCLRELEARTAGRRVFLIGASPLLDSRLGDRLVADPEKADLLLVLGHGLVTDAGLAAVEGAGEGRETLLLGPSTGGVAMLLECAHWCPYGR